MALRAVDDARGGSPPWRYQDAMDEALVAVEQVVIPRQQPIELLPQTPELLDMQVSPWSSAADASCSFWWL